MTDRLVVTLDDLDDPGRGRPPPPPRPPGSRSAWIAAGAAALALLVVGGLFVFLLDSGDEAGAARLQGVDDPGPDPFTESIANETVRVLGDEPEAAPPGDTGDTDPRLTVVEEPTVVASLATFDQATVPLVEVDEVLRFVPGIKADGVDAKTQVLDTSVYASLEPGSWMVFVAPFEDQTAAAAYCRRVAEVAPDCEPALVDGFGQTESVTQAAAPPVDERGRLRAGRPTAYAGTAGAASCDQASLVRQLQEDQRAGAAWARTLGIGADEIEPFVGGLTAVLLRTDTIVTNHDLVGDDARPFTAVLERGTPVLIDRRGVPRTRCVCGGPLLPPRPGAVADVRDDGADFDGDAWEGFDPGGTVRVRAAPEALETITLVDETTGRTIERPFATTGAEDLADTVEPELVGAVELEPIEIEGLEDPGGDLGLRRVAVRGDEVWVLGTGTRGGEDPVLARSPDGTTWSSVDPPASATVLTDLVTIRGELFLFGDAPAAGWSVFRFAEDGWVEVDEVELGGQPLDGIPTSVAVDADGALAIARSDREVVPVVARSADGVTWEQSEPVFDGPSVLFGELGTAVSNHAADRDGFVATGSAAVDGRGRPAWWASEDGTAWERQLLPASAASEAFHPQAVTAVGDAMLVAGAEQSASGDTSRPALLRSFDRSSWERLDLDPSVRPFDLEIQGESVLLAGSIIDDGRETPMLARLAFTGDDDGAEPPPEPPPETPVAETTIDGQPVPPEVLDTARAIYLAAESGDFDTLGELAGRAPDFTYSFGAPPGDPIPRWTADGGDAIRADLTGALSSDVAAELNSTTGETLYWWPAAFVTDAEPFFGFRVGIDDSGIWRLAVAGD